MKKYFCKEFKNLWHIRKLISPLGLHGCRCKERVVMMWVRCKGFTVPNEELYLLLCKVLGKSISDNHISYRTKRTTVLFHFLNLPFLPRWRSSALPLQRVSKVFNVYNMKMPKNQSSGGWKLDYSGGFLKRKDPHHQKVYLNQQRKREEEKSFWSFARQLS